VSTLYKAVLIIMVGALEIVDCSDTKRSKTVVTACHQLSNIPLESYKFMFKIYI
jgi:hypothetical protein